MNTHSDRNVTHFAVVSDWACKQTSKCSHTKFFKLILIYRSAHETTPTATAEAAAAATAALSAFNGDCNGIFECISVTIQDATITDMNTKDRKIEIERQTWSNCYTSVCLCVCHI